VSGVQHLRVIQIPTSLVLKTVLPLLTRLQLGEGRVSSRAQEWAGPPKFLHPLSRARHDHHQHERDVHERVDDRDALQAEVKQLADEIDRVSKQTSFNGKKVLDGSFTAADNLSTVIYGENTSTVTASGITAYATEIAAGILTIQSGTATAVDLGVIEAASSETARLGQVVEAINRKTADTGVSAFLVDNEDGTFDVELLSSKLNAAGTAPAAVVFGAGFTAAGTASFSMASSQPGANKPCFPPLFNQSLSACAKETCTHTEIECNGLLKRVRRPASKSTSLSTGRDSQLSGWCRDWQQCRITFHSPFRS
jgi:flagellin-like hook-associated protein FlgL